MRTWLETLAVTLMAVAGVLLGWRFSKLRKPYWLIGYFLPLALVFLFVAVNQKPSLIFVPPFSWLMMGRNKFAVFGFIAAMVLTTPMSRLRRRRDRVFVLLLMAVIVWAMSIWPFLAPAFNRNYLSRLQTRIDANGICRQNTDYTCAPAAVTALRKLGFPAEEGEIAILAHTSSAVGTPPDILADALRQRYGKDGLDAEFRMFNNIRELRNGGITLADIRFTLMIDHCVAVLDVTDDSVVIGDPLSGRTVLSYDEFAKKWYYVGVVLRRRS